MDKFLKLFSQASTWRGVMLGVAAFGLNIPEELITQFSLLLASFISVFYEE